MHRMALAMYLWVELTCIHSVVGRMNTMPVLSLNDSVQALQNPQAILLWASKY